MDSIEEHHKSFKEIIEKYDLGNEDKASEVAEYILKHNNIDLEEFSKIFNMNENDAKIFLSFIVKGIEFRKKCQ